MQNHHVSFKLIQLTSGSASGHRLYTNETKIIEYQDIYYILNLYTTHFKYCFALSV